MNYFFEDFTDEEYKKDITLLKEKWTPIFFSDSLPDGRACLLRHDVDFSPHRALKIALIESNIGVYSTYFVYVHSNFYNLFESENVSIFRKIFELGHQIGLHFDPHFYKLQPDDFSGITKWMNYEKHMLEEILDLQIFAFSLHMPGINGWENFNYDFFVGMVNTYGKRIQGNFFYCSDSNGYWRFSRLYEVLEKGEYEKLHILTHPELWTPSVLSPRDRIIRCIEGRAKKQLCEYDALLNSSGRENIK